MIKRPQPDEYSAYAARYVNLVPDGPILDILESQKDSTYKLFSAIDAEKAGYAYEEGKWTVKEMLGHMADTERVFAFRALAFSHEAIELPGFDQDVYMVDNTFNSRPIEDIANEFKTLREATLYLFRAITDERSEQKGIASGNPVSVRALAYMIAGHELHHLNILKERYL